MKLFIIGLFISLQSFAALEKTQTTLLPNQGLFCIVNEEWIADQNGKYTLQDVPRALMTAQSVLSRMFDKGSEEFRTLAQVDTLFTTEAVPCETIRKIQDSSNMNFGFLPTTIKVKKSDPIQLAPAHCVARAEIEVTITSRNQNLQSLVLKGQDSVSVPCADSSQQK